jgi:hypothetical protein
MENPRSRKAGRGLLSDQPAPVGAGANRKNSLMSQLNTPPAASAQASSTREAEANEAVAGNDPGPLPAALDRTQAINLNRGELTMEKPKLELVEPEPAIAGAPAEAVSIAKPDTFDMNRFTSKRGHVGAGVETLQTALPHHSIAQANDFVRLHADEEKYWSPELCFVSVPIKGVKRDTLHLIEEELAMQHLPSARILRFRLALATKPYDTLFLCHVPSQNLDNDWNLSNLQACEQAKTLWTQATSRRGEGVDGYKIDFAKDSDAFLDPQWPAQSLIYLIEKTFSGRMIDHKDHRDWLA